MFRRPVNEGFKIDDLDLIDQNDDVYILARLKDGAIIDASPFTIEEIEENGGVIILVE